MSQLKHRSTAVVALSCLAIGAGAGASAGAIAAAGAATTQTTKTAATHHKAQAAHAATTVRATELLRLARRSVAGTMTVATKTGFATVRFDRGFVQSVSGQQLTMTDATAERTSTTVTLTIPETARIRDNGTQATLASLAVGQHVTVIEAPKRTFVLAHDKR